MTEMNLIEIDRATVIVQGVTRYVKVPEPVKIEFDLLGGEKVVWYRDANSGEVILRVVKEN